MEIWSCSFYFLYFACLFVLFVICFSGKLRELGQTSLMGCLLFSLFFPCRFSALPRISLYISLFCSSNNKTLPLFRRISFSGFTFSPFSSLICSVSFILPLLLFIFIFAFFLLSTKLQSLYLYLALLTMPSVSLALAAC